MSDAASSSQAVTEAQLKELIERGVASRLAAMQAAAAAPPAAGALITMPPGGALPRASMPRLAAPPLFDGSADKLEAWTGTMRQQFAYYQLDDAQQVRLAAGCMTGPALLWYEGEAAQGHPANWAALDKALRSRFQPVTSSEIALGQLLVIAQGKASVHAYVDRFRALAARVPAMDDGTRTQLFVRGLQPEIARLLRMHGVVKLDEAIVAAVRIGSADAAVAAITGPPSARLNAMLGLDAADTDSVGSSTPGDAPVTRADLMQLLNAMRDERRPQSSRTGSQEGQRRGRFGAGLPRIPHLTPIQVKEYMDAGKCFSCESTEHRSRECPKRKEGADGRPGWSN